MSDDIVIPELVDSLDNLENFEDDTLVDEVFQTDLLAVL